MSTAVNPFTGQVSSPRINIPVPAFLRQWGFTLQETMLDAAHSIKDADGIQFIPVLLAFLTAVLFGMVHIVGPGHGKLFTVGYFGSRRARLREGLWLSVLVNLLDSLSALLIVLVVYGILSLSIRQTGSSIERIAQLIAYGSISLLGLLHLLSHLRGGHSHSDHGSAENPHCGCNHSAPAAPLAEDCSNAGSCSSGLSTSLRPWMLALSIGIIPCPVSSAILAWGIVNNALGFGLLLVLGVSTGGMIAMTLFSLALISSKNGLAQLLERRGFNRVLEWFEFFSMGLIIVTGLLLFLSTL